MKRFIGIVAVLIITLLASGPATLASPPSSAGPRGSGIIAQVVAPSLNNPTAFTLDPNGRIFYGERFTGEIHIYTPSTHSDTTLFTVSNVATTSEQGLLGIALHPRYPDRPFVYVYATRDLPTGLVNQVLRIKDVNGTGQGLKVILTSNVTPNPIHNGGHIAFGPDRKLYVVIGEASNPAYAQDLSKTAGKILRINANGSIPRSNPFAGKPVFSYGLRNSFGFTFDPSTERLWETENGPECNDEINRVVKGGNYGWGPNETCSTPPAAPMNTNQDGPNPILPQAYYADTNAPVGTAFCAGCGLVDSEGRLFLGIYNDRQIRRAVLTADRRGIVSTTPIYTSQAAPLSLERGPNGVIYFSTQFAIYKLVNAA